MSYAKTEMKVIQWAENRGIAQHSSGLAQAKKTQEELDELVEALTKGDREATIDAYGDILVTLIVGCACEYLDLVKCLEHAYKEIKDRKGYLGADGVFVKEA